MIVIASFIIFLLALYLLCRDDFIFLRKNVSTEQIFDAAFLMTFIAILIARIGYVGLHPKSAYLNPLVFFLVPYFPGLSLGAAILGGVGFLLLYSRSKKMPTARLMDVISIAFLFAFAAGLLFVGGVDLVQRKWFDGGLNAVAGLISLFLALTNNRLFLQAKLRDGRVTLSSLTFFAFISILLRVSTLIGKKPFIFDFEIILFALLLFSVGSSMIFRGRPFKGK